jgi:hypothetical protein
MKVITKSLLLFFITAQSYALVARPALSGTYTSACEIICIGKAIKTAFTFSGSEVTLEFRSYPTLQNCLESSKQSSYTKQELTLTTGSSLALSKVSRAEILEDFSLKLNAHHAYAYESKGKNGETGLGCFVLEKVEKTQVLFMGAITEIPATSFFSFKKKECVLDLRNTYFQ